MLWQDGGEVGLHLAVQTYRSSIILVLSLFSGGDEVIVVGGVTSAANGAINVALFRLKAQ